MPAWTRSPRSSSRTLARGHWLLGAARHGTVHDFGGFPAALYRVRYDAPGSPAVADRAAALLAAAGLEAQVIPQGGLDHGIWSPLRLVFPAADVPIVPLSFAPTDSPVQRIALGRAPAQVAKPQCRSGCTAASPTAAWRWTSMPSENTRQHWGLRGRR